MTIEEEFQLFINNEEKMKTYHQAVSMLREVGFDRLMRRLGEPVDMDVNNPRCMEISAALQMHSNGYYDAIDSVFNVRALDKNFNKPEVKPVDFGADDMMNSLGYTNE